MTTARRSISASSAWDRICSGVGYHLDNLGRWLIVNAPAIGSTYAAFLAPGVPRLRPRPGWMFAEEYYEQRRWLACRRGALWEAAREKDLAVPITVRWHGGTTVDLTLGNDNSLCLYVCGSFEPNEFAFLDRVLKPGMVFVDVGANDGYYTLFAARRVGPSGRVVAAEPSSRERAHLQRNLGRNGLDNVIVVPAAIGAAAGLADLHLAHGVHAGHNTLGSFAHDDVVRASLERVPIEPLDAVIARLGLAQGRFREDRRRGRRSQGHRRRGDGAEARCGRSCCSRSTTRRCGRRATAPIPSSATLRDDLQLRDIRVFARDRPAGTPTRRSIRSPPTSSPYRASASPTRSRRV